MAFQPRNSFVGSQQRPDASDLAAEADVHPFIDGEDELAQRQQNALPIPKAQAEDPNKAAVDQLSKKWEKKQAATVEQAIAIAQNPTASSAQTTPTAPKALSTPAPKAAGSVWGAPKDNAATASPRAANLSAPAVQAPAARAAAPGSWGQPKLLAGEAAWTAGAAAPTASMPAIARPAPSAAQQLGQPPLPSPANESAIDLMAPKLPPARPRRGGGAVVAHAPSISAPAPPAMPAVSASWGAPKAAQPATAKAAPKETPTAPEADAPLPQSILSIFPPSDLGRLSPTEEESIHALGVSTEDFLTIEKTAISALRGITSNLAVFGLKKWSTAFVKADADLAHWTEHAKWPLIRRLVLSKIGAIPLNESGNQDGDWAQYTTRAMVAMENEMLELSQRQTQDHVIPQELLEKAFASRPTMADEQKEATLACCSGSGAVVIVEGTAGAGKSFTLNAVREVYENVPARTEEEGIGYDIMGTALSWTATKVLEASAGLKGGRAIEGLVNAMDKAREEGRDFFPRRTVLIVDEAGLVGTVHMTRLLRHCAQSRHPVRLVLTGDSLQLAPVMAGNALEAMVEVIGSARLDTIRRQKQASHRQAVKHFCYRRSQNGLFSYWQQEAIHFCANPKARFERVIGDFVSWQIENPTKTGLVLAGTNDDVRHLNLAIRDSMKKAGRVSGPENMMRVTDGKTQWEAPFAVGDQIVFRKNLPNQPIFKSQFKKTHEALSKEAMEKARKARGGVFGSLLSALGMGKPDEVQGQGLFNRSCGIILSIKPQMRRPGTFDLRVLLADETGGEVVINTGDYIDEETKAIPLTHNFATTIYASQGQTVNRVLMLDSEQIACRLAYVGMSRHTELCDIYVDVEEMTKRMKKQLDREKEGAWKSYARERLRMKKRMGELQEAKTNPWKDKPRSIVSQAESARNLRDNLSNLSKKDTDGPPPQAMMLAAMAQTWNKDSANPTAFIARKRAAERKQAMQPHLMLPHRALEDNPDDHPDERWPKPAGFGLREAHATRAQEEVDTAAKLTHSFMGLFVRSKAIESGSVVPAAASSALKISEMDGVSQELADATHGPIWALNRFGEERFLARDPNGEIMARYDVKGHCVVGDGDPAVFPNADQLAAGQPAPFLIVPDARAALISYAHYRQKHAGSPEKIPHIVAGFGDTDWSKMEAWAGRLTQARFFVAWSPRDPDSFAKADAIAQRLIAHGAQVSFNPKPPVPQEVAQAVAPPTRKPRP